MLLIAKNLQEMEQAGKVLAEHLKSSNVVAFEGDMGAGKTTLIKFICAELGVQDEVNSPTFSLVNEYLTAKRETVYHFDLYRLNTPEEALSFGIEEYLDSGKLCLIEWPENLGEYLPSDVSKIKIEDKGGVREIFFQP
ncbi:MAG: tRNA threonylcarbamoyladenosine biosynthesis protein TsaE [Flavobacteriales bacterium]|jgi:tRNA threonylcarbamoyladenosine biosynthesis protein TsaE